MTSAAGTGGLALVTGATGFIGRHLVAALLAAGKPVRVLVRAKPGRSPTATDPVPLPFPVSPQTPGAELAWGSLDDAAAVERAARGVDTIFHLAGCVRAWARDPREFMTVNVAGTQAVLRAALACGTSNVVHVSTELVQEGIEDRTAYQRTKRAAEALVAGYVGQGRRAVIVRPTRVYGPGPLNAANSVTRVIDLYRRGLFRVRIADGGARANYVYVEDVVDGLLRAAASGANGAAYLVGGENLTLPELLAVVAEASGATHAVVPLPRPVARVAAGLCELGALAGIEPPITRDWVALLTEDRPMSSARAQAELGYAARSAREGVGATVKWLATR
jgi:nucleoside-diphosphate-sugar epimerase